MPFFQLKPLPPHPPRAIRLGFALLFLIAALSPPALAQNTPQPPDAMESLAQEAMRAILLNERQTLKEIQEKAKLLQAQQAKLPGSNPPRTPDIIALIEAWMAPSPTEKNRLLKKISASDPARVVQRQARDALDDQNAERIRLLRRQDRYNRFTHVFNYFTRLATGLVTANPQALLHRFADLFFIKEHLTKITPRNSLALDSYKRWEKETLTPASASPPSDQNETTRKEIRKDLLNLIEYIDRLQRRQDRLRVRRAIERGNYLLSKERWPEARAAYALALASDPESQPAQEGRLEAAQKISAQYRQRLASLKMPTRPQPASDAETQDARKIALALCAGPKDQITAAATNFVSDHPTSPLWDDAWYAQLTAGTLPFPSAATSTTQPLAPPPSAPAALARQLLEHDALKNRNAARHLQATETSPHTSPRARLAQANQEKRANLRKYILLGATQDPNQPPSDTFHDRLNRRIDSIGILLPFQWIARAIRAQYTKPVPDDPWRTAALRYLNAPPQSPGQNPETRRAAALQLSQSYEHMGLLNQARHWHTQALGQEDSAHTARLDQKAAHSLLAAANDHPDPAQSRLLTQQAAQRYPHTKSGQKALKRLQEMDQALQAQTLPDGSPAPPPENAPDQLHITKKQLLSWPQLWHGRGLRLPPELLDNDPANGELRKDGVHFLAPHGKTIVYTILTPQGDKRHILSPDPAALQRLSPALKAWQRELAHRQKYTDAYHRPLPPMELEGSAGPSGIDLYPRLLPLPFNPQTLPLYQE